MQRTGKTAAAATTATPSSTPPIKKGFESLMAVPTAASSTTTTTSQEESSERESEQGHQPEEQDQLKLADRSATPENWFDTDTDFDDTKDAIEEMWGEQVEEDEEEDTEEEEEHEDDKVVVVNDDEDEEEGEHKADETDTDHVEREEQQVIAGTNMVSVAQESEEARRTREMNKNVGQMLAKMNQLEEYVMTQEGRLLQMEAWRTKVETGLREEIRNLIEQVKIMKSNGQANGAAEQKKQTVKVTPGADGSGAAAEVFEFSTNSSGDLSVNSVRAFFPDATALTYQREGGVIRVCSIRGTIFDAPEEGWGDRLYVVSQPRQQRQQQQSMLQGQQTPVNPVMPAPSHLNPVGVQHAPLPGSYLSANPLASTAMPRIPGHGFFRPSSNGF